MESYHFGVGVQAGAVPLKSLKPFIGRFWETNSSVLISAASLIKHCPEIDTSEVITQYILPRSCLMKFKDKN